MKETKEVLAAENSLKLNGVEVVANGSVDKMAPKDGAEEDVKMDETALPEPEMNGSDDGDLLVPRNGSDDGDLLVPRNGRNGKDLSFCSDNFDDNLSDVSDESMTLQLSPVPEDVPDDTDVPGNDLADAPAETETAEAAVPEETPEEASKHTEDKVDEDALEDALLQSPPVADGLKNFGEEFPTDIEENVLEEPEKEVVEEVTGKDHFFVTLLFFVIMLVLIMYLK